MIVDQPPAFYASVILIGIVVAILRKAIVYQHRMKEVRPFLVFDERLLHYFLKRLDLAFQFLRLILSSLFILIQYIYCGLLLLFLDGICIWMLIQVIWRQVMKFLALNRDAATGRVSIILINDIHTILKLFGDISFSSKCVISFLELLQRYFHFI